MHSNAEDSCAALLNANIASLQGQLMGEPNMLHCPDCNTEKWKIENRNRYLQARHGPTEFVS